MPGHCRAARLEADCRNAGRAGGLAHLHWGESMSILHLVAALALSGSPVPTEKLTNQTIVMLTTAGLGDEAIIAKIRGSEVEFDLSTDQMIELKRRGVSGPVIAAMLTASTGDGGPGAGASSIDSPDPMRAHSPGVYLLREGGARMTRMDPTVSNQAKTGGLFGFALTGGLASMSVKASISNETARVGTVAGTPVFYFFFEEASGQTAGAFSSGIAAVATSPNEFTLIRLDRKKGRREARVGSRNIAGAKTGVMDKDRIAFTYDMVRPGVFKVTPSTPLSAGEYGFIYAISGEGAGGAMTARIFDFSVR